MNKNFGEKLRFERLARKIALKDLAADCGLSYSYISQVERGEASPSLSALDRLAKALDTTVWKLLRDDAEASESVAVENGAANGNPAPVQEVVVKRAAATRISKVVRKNMRRSVILPQTNVRYQMLSAELNSAIQLLMMEAEPGANSGDQAFEHGGEECCFVLEGRVDMDVGAEKFILEAGDSIYFSSELPHRWKNIGDGKLVLLLAVTPPAY